MGGPDSSPSSTPAPTPAPTPGIAPTYPYVETPSYVLKVSQSNAEITATTLTKDANDLAQAKVVPVPAAAFGPSGLGQALATHTDLAQQKLHGAVRLMAGAMHGYSVAVIKAKDTLLGTDESSKQSLAAVEQQITTSTHQIATPVAAAPAAPNAPGGDPHYTTPGSDSGPCAPPSGVPASGPASSPLADYDPNDPFGATRHQPLAAPPLIDLNGTEGH